MSDPGQSDGPDATIRDGRGVTFGTEPGTASDAAGTVATLDEADAGTVAAIDAADAAGNATAAVLPDPAARTPRRAAALLEVILCSGFPTQVALSTILSAAGLAAIAADGQPSYAYVVTVALADAVVVCALIVFCLHAQRESVRGLVLGARPPGREAALGALLTPPIVIGAMATLLLIGRIAPSLRNVPDNPFAAMIASPASAVLFAVVAITAGGFREELQRAFILRRFEQHLGGGWLGLVVFSVVFGLGHLIQGWDTVLVTMALGAFWGALYLTRGSAIAAITSHAGFNLTQIAVAAGGSWGGT